MTINKQALDLVGVSIEQYLDYCEQRGLKANYKKTRKEFFKRIKEGRIVMDSKTGELLDKRPREVKDEND